VAADDRRLPKLPADKSRPEGTLMTPLKDGNIILSELYGFLTRHVAFPSPEAADAVTLWAVHTHLVPAFESTPRLAILSPDKGSGKTRLLEMLELVCARATHAVNLSAAALFRIVAASTPTMLFDEADTFFGPKAKEHEELRGLINAGHRKGAQAYRCVGDPAKMEVRAFPAYCPVALAGIGDLPDTILDRSILIKMQRRRAEEKISPFRQRHTAPEGKRLHDAIANWAAAVHGKAAEHEPKMPETLVDRPADVWEPLIIIADLAGGSWAVGARHATVKLNAERAERDPSLGAKLLSDIKAVFDGYDKMPTVTLLEKLISIEESPWGDLRGKPLDARGLSRRLSKYEIKPKTIRILDTTAKGYESEQFYDAWARYCLTPSENSVTSVTTDTSQVRGAGTVPDTLFAAASPSVTVNGSTTRTKPLTSTVASVTDVTDFSRRERDEDLGRGEDFVEEEPF
jgi:hypothetical protein